MLSPLLSVWACCDDRRLPRITSADRGFSPEPYDCRWRQAGSE